MIRIYMKKIFKLLYVIDICVLLLSADFVVRGIIAIKTHDDIALMGLTGMYHYCAIKILIISSLIFTIFTILLIKSKKKK